MANGFQTAMTRLIAREDEEIALVVEAAEVYRLAAAAVVAAYRTQQRSELADVYLHMVRSKERLFQTLRELQ